jgi:hypothetical protein
VERLLIRDFNEAMWSFDHLFAQKRPEQQMAVFQDALHHCELHNLDSLGFHGPLITSKGGEECKGQA